MKQTAPPPGIPSLALPQFNIDWQDQISWTEMYIFNHSESRLIKAEGFSTPLRGKAGHSQTVSARTSRLLHSQATVCFALAQTTPHTHTNIGVVATNALVYHD